MSLIYTLNNFGPKTDPWGTPQTTYVTQTYVVPFSHTVPFLLNNVLTSPQQRRKFHIALAYVIRWNDHGKFGEKPPSLMTKYFLPHRDTSNFLNSIYFIQGRQPLIDNNKSESSCGSFTAILCK